MSDNEKNPEQTENENISEEERLFKIRKYRELLEKSDEKTFLTPIEKLYIMGNLCALKDKQACQNFAEVTLELTRLAEQENNEFAKDMLKQLGIWKEKPKKTD
ncbi:MAG: hypothetical protein ACP5U0_08585 [Caldisphaera sp.]